MTFSLSQKNNLYQYLKHNIIFKQTLSNKNNNLLNKIDNNQEIIQNNCNNLILDKEELESIKNKNLKKNINIINNKDINKKKSHVSRNSQKLINIINKSLNNLNFSIEELNKLNTIYFTNISENLNKNKNLSPYNFIGNNNEIKNNLPKINNKKQKNEILNMKLYFNDNNFIKSKSQKNFINSRNKIDYDKINKENRKELNLAFLSFNPLINLKNMRILSNLDSNIKNDIENMKNKINNDIKITTSPTFYKTRYENVKKFYAKEKYKKNINNIENYLKNDKLINSLKNINKQENQNNNIVNENGKLKINKSKRKSLLFRERKQLLKQKENKEFPEKNFHQTKLNLMNMTLNKIGRALSDENMNKYFDNINDIKTKEIDLQKKIYFNNIENAKNNLIEIEKLNYFHDTNVEENKIKNYVQLENKNLISKIDKFKDVINNDLNNII